MIRMESPARADGACKPSRSTTPGSEGFRRIGLFGRYQSAGVGNTLREIADFLHQQRRSVTVEAGTAAVIDASGLLVASAAEIGQNCDLAIVVGGDGTMLGIARELAPYEVPLIGINHGRLGFMTDIALAHWREALTEILPGRFESEQRSMLQARVMRGEETVFSARALNDVVVARGASGRMVELHVHVDGYYMYTQRADGLIAATPTGSTAYALSANGPILHPALGGIVLVPVAPQALSNRPIVLPDRSIVSIQVSEARDARVNCDMQTFTALEAGDRIDISRADDRIEFLHPPGYSFFATLRQKLHWHATPVDWSALPSMSEPTS